MSASDLELQKMVRGFRVSDLQSLLVYAGRNKGGKKTELQNRALDLIKLHSDSINMKIRELHINRYQQGRGHAEPAEMFPLGAINDTLGNKHYSTSSNHQAPMGLGLGIPNYVPSMNRQMMSHVPDLNPLSRYPVNPDVTFKALPFYDVLTDLLKPTSLVPLRGDGIVQEKELIFYFRPQDLRELDNNIDVQVQFRIGCLESNQEQEDEFPTSICLKVNHKVAALPNQIPTNKPGQDPKRPKRPVDITSLIRRSTSDPQVVYLSWASNNNKPYVIAVFLVRKQTSSVLIKRLKDMGVRNPDHTTAMIKEKLCHDRDSEIATMSLRGSLICPLGKIKMMLPCRALTCTHLQCFDAALYVQMNEKKPKWICPVCDKPAEFKNLAIDGLFLDITRKVPAECMEVQFHENGSWTPVIPLKKAVEAPEVIQAEVTAVAPPPKVDPKPKNPTKSVEIISLDSDSDTEESWAIAPPKKKPYKPIGIISPVTVQNENSILSQDSRKFPDLVQPGPSKFLPSTSNGSTMPLDKGSSSVFNNYSYNLTDIPSPPYPQTPPPPGTSAFQEPIDLQNSSSPAGQCSYDFDLYSLITPNTSENFQYDEPAANDLPQDEPDIISID